MTKDEALKLALQFVEDSECGTADLEAHIKEALAQRTWVEIDDEDYIKEEDDGDYIPDEDDEEEDYENDENEIFDCLLKSKNLPSLIKNKELSKSNKMDNQLWLEYIYY